MTSEKQKTPTLEELRKDRRWMIGAAVGSVAIFGASVGAIYGAVTGKIGSEGYLGAFGIPIFGKTAAYTIGGAFSLSREIRSAERAEKTSD
ncbi:hypothetical protein HYS84_02285 [Candidatus Saccharibacteria bacterium]|nr:hypothetical protein [Candidatus Saccharibacteria bacterium]